MSRFLVALWAMLAAALSACGGGGGGDAPPAVLALSPTSLAANYEAGTSITLTVLATATNPAAFSGAVYVVVADPNQVLTGTVNLTQVGAAIYAATVYTSATLPAGRHQGTLQVHLCRDPQCASQMAGSPVPLPYDLTVTAAPLRAVSITSTAGTVHHGGSIATATTVHVTGPSLPWTASTGASWLRIDNGAGTGPGSLSVSYLAAGLAIGSYADKVTVRASDGQSAEVPFTLDVLPTQFVVTSGVPSFAAVNGAPIPPQTLAFSLDNDVASPWTASSSAPWMIASALSGTTPASVTLQPDPSVSALASGSYTADIVLSSPGIADKTVTANLTLTQATLSAASNSLTLGGSKGRNLDVPQSLAVSLNTGTRSWPWTVSTLPAWLSTTTPSGSVNQDGASFAVAPNLAGVTAGSVSATVTLSATVNGDTVTLPLTVNLNADQRRLLVSDWGVGLADTPTGSVLTRSVTVSDNFGGAVPWSAVSDTAWLTATAGGTTGGGSTLTLTADPASLPADTVSHANVTLSTTTLGMQPAVVRVALWKAATGPAAVTTLPVRYASIVADKIRPYVYVNNNGSSIDVYHAYTAQLAGTIPGVAPALGQMAVSADGSRLFALDTTNGAIAVVDLATRTKVEAWPLGSAVSAQTPLLVIRPNGVDVLLVGNGRAYSEGRNLGLSGIVGDLLTASSDGRRIYTQSTRVSPSEGNLYDVDYSAISGGVLMVNRLVHAPSFSAVSGRDIAVSGDGTRLYAGREPPYKCASVDPATLRTIEGLPGVDNIYLNNIEVASDGRTICGGQSTVADTNVIEVHAADGNLLKTITFRVASGIAGMLNQQMVITPDGFVAVAVTREPSMVFVPIGP